MPSHRSVANISMAGNFGVWLEMPATIAMAAPTVRDHPTAPRSPWQNGNTERTDRSIRRECLDHIVVFGEAHCGHAVGHAGHRRRGRAGQGRARSSSCRASPADGLDRRLRPGAALMFEEDLPRFYVRPGEDFDQAYARALKKARMRTEGKPEESLDELKRKLNAFGQNSQTSSYIHHAGNGRSTVRTATESSTSCTSWTARAKCTQTAHRAAWSLHREGSREVPSSVIVRISAITDFVTTSSTF